VPPASRGGFEVWEGFESGFQLNDPWLHGSRFAQPVKFSGYQSDVVTERAAAWFKEIENPKSKIQNHAPWFCVVSLEAPHPPYDAPAASIAARDPAEILLPANVPRGGDAEAKARRELAGYYAHIEATDRAIGRLLAGVNRDDTIIVFTSVHGDMHGAHGLFRKGWPHEESVRVPLLLCAPGQAPGRDESPISLVDLPALTLAQIENRKSKIENRPAQISMPSVVALPHQCDRVWRGVRTPMRKLVLNADGSPWLCFDLANDPLEMKNLAGDPAWAEEIARLTALVAPA
jgi:arylsulfatase A-like enzyme